VVGSVSARTDSIYSVVVPTVLDSNATGAHWVRFFVSAATATPSIYYDSAPDSGYSVDNLAPATPSPFTGTYAGGVTHLHWGASSEPDFWYYTLHRGTAAAFVPSTANLIASQADTGYVDAAGAPYFYKLAAANQHISFRIDDRSGRLQIQVHDLNGNVLFDLPPDKALEAAADGAVD